MMPGIRDLGYGIFSIDAGGKGSPFPRYSYCIVEAGQGALIDPGPLEDFDATRELVRSVLPIERVSLIILSADTPDACSSVPLWKAAGFAGIIRMHRKAQWLAGSYLGAQPLNIMTSDDERADLGSGRQMRFINVPGIPSAGSLFCFDERSGSLFTGMLFGSLSGDDGASDEDIQERSRSFHELMFPRLGTRADIRELMEGLKPSRVLPRCGPPLESRLALANALFYGDDCGTGDILSDLARIKTENLELKKSIIQANEDQLKDPVTGFYNELFFEEYLESLLLPGEPPAFGGDTVAFIRLDGIQGLNRKFGAKSGDTALKGLGQLLFEHKRANALLFRMNGPLFAYYLQGSDKETAIAYMRGIKELIEDSEDFVDKVTVSAAIVSMGELGDTLIDSGKLYSSVMKVGKERLRLLDKLGPNSICSESAITLRRSSGTVLLIEGNAFEADLLRRILERQGFETHVLTKGSEAIAMADLHRPDVVIAEIFIPQMDGFQIRQRLRESPDLKNIPFILMSRDKSEASVQKALNLGIKHFYKKPILALELAGIIRLLIEESAEERHP
jgi:diguanylate cyclase (GGDEF)-like protein